jgi:ABC-type nickel/cobalt efflux system permease component RcnA
MSNTVAQIRTRMPRIAEVAAERARLTVVPRRRTRAARMPFVALVSMVLLGGVVGLLLFNTSMQQASFAATALEDQANTLAARQQTLQMDLERLRNPQRIAKAAVGLGMVQAGSPAFLELGSGRIRGVGGVGDPANQLRIDPRPPKKPALLDPAPSVVTVPATGSGDTGAGSARNEDNRDRKSHRHHENKQHHENHQSQQPQH